MTATDREPSVLQDRFRPIVAGQQSLRLADYHISVEVIQASEYRMFELDMNAKNNESNTARNRQDAVDGNGGHTSV